MDFTRREVLLTFAALRAAKILRADEPQAAFSSDVRVVNSFVTVHDKKGNIVTDLTKDDFEIWEDGRPQTIRYFSRQTDLPLRLGLVVDNTPSESNMAGVERNASSVFFDQVLRPDKDKAFVIRFGNDVELLQDLTNSREKLNRALDVLDNPANDNGPSDPANGGGPGRGRGGGGPNSTVLSDSIYLASNEVLQSETGRKALIVLGDGDHIGNRESQAVDAAQKSNCVVYAVRIYDKNFGGGGSRWRGLSVPGLGVPGMGGGPTMGGGGPGMGGGRGPGNGGPGGMGERSNGKQNLQDLASKTGGAAFEVTKKETLEQIYARIEQELRNQYSLGYSSDSTAGPGYRKLKIAAKKSGLIVQARQGYFADAKT